MAMRWKMSKSKKTKNSFMGSLITRPKLIGVAAAVAILLMLTLALSSANLTQEIRFMGTVTDKNPPGQFGSLWWNVTLEELISGPQTSCDTLRVRLVISPPWGYYDSDIAVGDRVDVYGNHTSDCTVSLNGESYYIKKITPAAPALTPTGLIALVGLLSAIAAAVIVRKRR
jgi:hypothetical protein